ncbi:hypothetical protein [Kitasatospora sp. NPDC096140]|uniref:hypothetical protein n=1 Tax=Kitasatospora sp. NPDC096140 TaxID=3155425 RepID=UPI00332510E2
MGTGSGLEEPFSEVESTLVESVGRGKVFDLVGKGTVDPTDRATMLSWRAARTIRASVVRGILCGRLVQYPDPHGLRLRGAIIEGQLDLDNLTSTVPLELTNCLLGAGVVARYARLPALGFTGCRIERLAESALDASGCLVPALRLDGAVVEGDTGYPVVALRGARIGRLDCSGAILRNVSGPALAAEGLQAEQGVFLDSYRQVRFEAVGSGTQGAVRLNGARVGRLECGGAILRNVSGPALVADGLQAEQGVFLNSAVGLLRFEAVGSGTQGVVRLAGARVGRLECGGAILRNVSGPALAADGLQAEQGVFLDSYRQVRFEAVGSGTQGAVRLAGARVGRLQCQGASLRNVSGPGLVAESLQADQGVYLNPSASGMRFEAVGSGTQGAVRLAGARVGRLECQGASLRSDSGPALAAEGLQADQGVHLAMGFEAMGGGHGATLDLTDMRIGENFQIDWQQVRHAKDSKYRVRLDGLVFPRIPSGSKLADWRALLRNGTPEYAAQPYQQLASVYRAAGHDREVRQVLMAQRRDQLDGGMTLTGRGERAWVRVTGWTLGFGYQPWRALFGLIAAVVCSVALALTLGANGGLSHPPTPGASMTMQSAPAATECSAVEQVAVGLDASLPLVKTGIQGRCVPTDTPAGQALTAAGWILQLLAWASSSLFIVGFTGVVRKS